MQDEFNVKFSMKEIQEALKQVLNKDSRELMSECILSLIGPEEDKLQILLKCSMGIEPVIDYKVGDQVICKYRSLHDWQFDRDAMIAAGILKDDCMIVTIGAINKFKPQPYTMFYKFLSVPGKEESTTSDVKSEHIVGYAETWPGD